MGCDIHGVFQRYDSATGKWLDVPSKYEQDRHYQLFAVLANVRNGHGFAGIKTGEFVKPIASPRGLPADFAIDANLHPLTELAHMAPRRQKYYEDGELWMGDHSHSWLTGEEMLGWVETAPTVAKIGILSREEYEKWDGKTEPLSYSGGVSGRNVRLTTDNAVAQSQMPDWNYIRCYWSSDLRSELAYFFDEVARLVSEHGRVRFVFGFDS